MALLASLLVAVQVAISIAATISGDYGANPVRRQAARQDPMSLKAESEELSTVYERLSVLTKSMLPKDWPACKTRPDHNWNTDFEGQFLRKINVQPNVSSPKHCADSCGSSTFKFKGETVACAGWSYVVKEWAKEFQGHKSCAMFGFMKNDLGAVRAPVRDLTFKSHCCTTGTPCQHGEVLGEYDSSTDRVATAYDEAKSSKSSEIGANGRDKSEDVVAAPEHGPERHSMTFIVVLAILIAVGFAVIGTIVSWSAGYMKK